MKVHFRQPPPDQRTGGLDQAIQSLREFLVSEGWTVDTNHAASLYREPPDVVHFHGLWQWGHLSVSRACRKLGIPYLVSPHGMLEPWAWRHKAWKKYPYFQLAEKFHLRGATRLLATSDQEAANLSRFFPSSQIAAVPLGVPGERQPDRDAARRRLGWADDECVLLFLSRIHEKKGLDLLLHALSSCVDSLPSAWRLVIVGSGEGAYLEKCRGISQSNAVIAAHTEWKGPVWGDDKWAYYQAADLFCLPSHSENFGLAIMEACQVGTRVLTTRHTPWTFLGDAGDAFLVEPDVASVKRGLRDFLNRRPWSPADRNRLSARIYERFGWDAVGPRYLQQYRESVARPSPSLLRA